MKFVHSLIWLTLVVLPNAFAQNTLSITGRITDSEGKGIANASIIVDGTTIGTTSNDRGAFTLALREGRYTLVFSSVGYGSVKQVVEKTNEKQQPLEVTLSAGSTQLNTVVISATRSERKLDELPIPMTIIDKDQIRNIGSLRLNDVLSEQTGLAIVTDHGIGLQVQGFAPEYTLILINGEPLIGRTAGTFDLTRVAVGNIKQVEILKGPSSSLYGSEALAGVVNIITDQPQNGLHANVTTRYGTNGTLDLGSDVSYKKNKFGVSAFANRYSTEGYDLNTQNFGNTVDPFSNYTFSGQAQYAFSAKVRLDVSGRVFFEDQNSKVNVGTESQPDILTGNGLQRDYNVNPTLSVNFSKKIKTTFRYYQTRYETSSKLLYDSDGSVYDESFFYQNFTRPEIQNEFFINEKQVFTLGIGRIWESVEATRYEGKKKFATNYLYFQHEWKPFQKLNIIAGGRYDDHSAYAAQFSPKLSAEYSLLNNVSVRASAGVGFKAPDFRQLYLNFTNAVAGYSVFGSKEVASGIASLQEQGQITNVLVDLSTFGNIRAESSIAYNLGFKIKPMALLTANVNLFHNDVKDLIDTQVVAQKTNGQNVFSYTNREAVYTQGAETDLSYMLTRKLTLSAGYQYLIAKDKAVIKQLESGQVFARDPVTQATRRVTEIQYGGLYNRSRHMLNAKLFFQDSKSGFNASLRAIYRGRYGFGDQNNNAILDADNEYVEGYTVVNASVAKTFNNFIRVQLGCDNLFNYTDPQFISALPGRLLWARVDILLSGKQ